MSDFLVKMMDKVLGTKRVPLREGPEPATEWGAVASDPKRTDYAVPLGAGHPFLSGPMKGMPRWQRNLKRKLGTMSAQELRERRWDIDDAETHAGNVEFRATRGHMRRRGIPETRPDVWPTPMNEVTQDRWMSYLQANPGMSPKEAADHIYDWTSSQGVPVAVLPADTEVVSPEDRHERDPWRGRNADVLLGRGSPMKKKGTIAETLVDQMLATERHR